ncbi:MAG: DUF4373 domain-containing protein [Spirochaetia bacterium]|nr:DUF4373 domain-containing protein [Spirochaetia bacterium]
MKDTFYMQHDTNASRDDAIVWMRSEYGAYGYGLYWLVNEYMRDQTGCKVSLDRVAVIAYALNEDKEKLEQFICDCINKYKLYKSDKSHFWSERLVKDKQALDNIREVNRQNGQRGGRPKREPNKNLPVSEEKPTANQPVSENEAIVKQEKRREEKRREENIIEYYAESEDSPIDEENLPAIKPQDQNTNLYQSVNQAFLSRNGDKFTNYGKEGTAIKQIITKATARSPDGAEDLIRQMMAKFWELKNSGDKFWRKQPFLPSALNAAGIWDRVLEEFREDGGGNTDRWIMEAESGSKRIHGTGTGLLRTV